MDDHVLQLVHERARQRAASLRWNTRVLTVAYVILTAAIMLAVSEVNVTLVALLAAFGLAAIWIVGRVQARTFERRVLEDEERAYAGLQSCSSFPLPNETMASAGEAIVDRSPLTERECEVLSQMAHGWTNKEIARALDISEQTVKNHIGHIFMKLEVNDRTSAVLLAIRRGWVENRGQ